MNNREDCFANAGNSCRALNEKNCEKCKFYRNDLKPEKIEKEIQKYISTKCLKNEL